MKFRKRPEEVEAIQYTGDNLKECLDFTGRHPKFDSWFESFEDYAAYVKVDGNVFKLFYANGSHQDARPGYWLVKNSYGTVSVWPNTTFVATYEVPPKS